MDKILEINPLTKVGEIYYCTVHIDCSRQLKCGKQADYEVETLNNLINGFQGYYGIATHCHTCYTREKLVFEKKGVTLLIIRNLK